MFKRPFHKHYISAIDKFLDKLRAKLPLSDSQKAEVDKYTSINRKRDNKENGA